MEILGKITAVTDVTKGENSEGKPWEKITFVVTTEEEYNNVYAFEVFGVDKVADFLKYNKVGKMVNVAFNVRTNEWKGKYFTSLAAWLIKSVEGSGAPGAHVGVPTGEDFASMGSSMDKKSDNDDDLPF